MRLLIVGSLEGHMTTAGQMAIKRGVKVAAVDSIDDGLANLRSGQGADLVMIDVRMNVASLITQLEAERIFVPVVACGIDGTDANAAVAAIKAGAKEYIPLPPDPELIAAILEAIAQESNAIIHSDVTMQRVLKLADQIAPSDASVLITGESGTGKEVMARYLHNKSKRATGAFVAVNCAAIPENLLESELFGHEKGAFSGAIARRIGKFEEASGGTILLDEVSEMDPRLQAKLLRVIQEREVDRVGGTKPVKVDVRILATSNRNLEEAIKNGSFREDLYFRLNVVNILLPSLRDRPNDVILLAKHFAEKYLESNGIDTKPITDAALDLLSNHDWPGNVRELENTLHRAVLLSGPDNIDVDAIMITGQSMGQPMGASTPDAHKPDIAETAAETAAVTHAQHADVSTGSSMVGQTVADVERGLIIDTLGHCLGNRTHAANILGISIRTLRNKLKQYGENGHPIPMPGESERS